MRHILHFVIRVYRRDTEVFAGLLEDVQTGRSRPFQSLGELCELLAARKPRPRTRDCATAPNPKP